MDMDLSGLGFGKLISHVLPGIPAMLALSILLEAIGVAIPEPVFLSATLFVVGTVLLGVWIDGLHHSFTDRLIQKLPAYQVTRQLGLNLNHYLTSIITREYKIDEQLILQVGPFSWDQYLPTFAESKYLDFMDYYFHYYECYVNLATSLLPLSVAAPFYVSKTLSLPVWSAVLSGLCLLLFSFLTFLMAYRMLILTRWQQLRLSVLVVSKELATRA